MKKKRHYSRMELEVSPHYVYPSPRRRWLNAGLAVAAVALLWTAFDFLLLDAAFVSSGPVSSAHMKVESDCSACHSPLRGTPEEKCASCHESLNADSGSGPEGSRMALYGYPAHYAYFSDDLERRGEESLEGDCASCHSEHLGRGASLTQVPDSRCTSCHDFASFARGHPEFLHGSGGVAQFREAEGLRFPHAVHVNKVLPEERKLEGDATCLYCHHPERDGRGFQALSFRLHCGDGCHLNKDGALMQLAQQGLSGAPGVLRPQQLEAADPAAPCLPTMNPSRFRLVPPQDPRRIRPLAANHRDCWIEENLRILRRSLHSSLGLADLLPQRPPQDFDPGLLRERYADAVGALSARLARARQLAVEENSALAPSLRPGGASDVRLQRAQEGLRDPGAVSPRSLLADPSHEPFNEIDRWLLEAWTDLRQAGYAPQPSFGGNSAGLSELVDALTQQCRECHDVSPRGLAPLRASQKTLSRALFDHSAHRVQMECASCHPSVAADQEDRGQRLHLPSIDDCRQCHAPGQVSQSCVTCHHFHPRKDRRLPVLLLRAREVADD